MPDPRPPANVGQAKRPLQLRTQPSLPEGELLGKGSYVVGPAPQVFQWVIHNELTPLTADLFLLWAKLYDVPGARPLVNIWHDSALPAGSALQHFLEYRFKVSVSGGETFKSHFLRHFMEEVFDEIGREGDWPSRIEGYLRSPNRSPAQQTWLKENELPAMEAAQRQQAELLAHMQGDLTNFNVNIYDLRAGRGYGRATPENHWYRRYVDLVYVENLPGWGKNLLLQHLINQGGRTIEAGAMPRLKDSVYTQINRTPTN